MGLSDFERKLERGVEGVFGRVFRSGVSPVEIGRKLVREMDVRRTVGVNGASLAPNSFVVLMAQADFDQVADMEDTLAHELAHAAKDHASTERYRFVGPVEVFFEIDPAQRPGVVLVDARFRQPEPGAVVAGLLLPGGNRIPLSDQIVTIGRSTDSTIPLTDKNASRRHAEIRPVDGAFVVVDLASTNGTAVNGRKIAEHTLRDGDEVVIGGTSLRFEQD